MGRILHVQTRNWQDRMRHIPTQRDFNDPEVIESARKEGKWRGVIFGALLALGCYLLALAVLSL